MISLVTACMNRESHLRRTLPSWLKIKGLDEIVIVDWSTQQPLTDLLELDSRIRIARVEDEPRWILSYAYNLGISQSRGDIILKCDADCIPAPEICSRYSGPDAFAAGHWKSGAAVGKPSVNGQCIFSRRQFETVNGYSELIRMYGRDDEDFYDRMIEAGFSRREISPTALSFLDHTQEARLANQMPAQEADSTQALLNSLPGFHEMVNLYISRMLPWGNWFQRATFVQHSSADGRQIFKREKQLEIPLSSELLQQARLHGTRAIVAQAFKLSPAAAARLDETSCRNMLRQRLGQKQHA